LVYKDVDPIVKLDFSQSDERMTDMFVLKLSFGEKKILQVLEHIKAYKSVIVFCPTVDTATRFSRIAGTHTAVVDGTTPTKERDELLKKFKSGEIQTIFNCEVLTTGFDHPSIDCIVLLRPTKSLTKMNQMIGRGTRLAPGKKSCDIYDLTGTVQHLGTLEDIVVCQDVYDRWNVKNHKGFLHNEMMSYYVRNI
jgi:DNA repair protein RadD